MTNDGNHAYFYDAENRLVQVDGTLGTCSTATACYLYDALGQRVDKQTGTYHLSYIHDLSGNGVTEYCAPCTWGTGWNRGYVYMNGQQVAEYAGGTTYFVHPDHLGSARLRTALNQSIYDSTDLLPFGEIIGSSYNATHYFTGDEHDYETNLDHTQFRQYSSQFGRWMHPDPAGLAAVDPSNPQSWNRYSYVLNNPLANTDPLGLYCVYLNDSGDTVEAIDDNSDSGSCGETGGYWIAGEYGAQSQISINSDLGLVSGYGYLDGSLQYSVAGASDSNAWGAWTQTAGPSSDFFGGNTGGNSGFMIDPTAFTNSVWGSVKFQVQTNLIANFCKDKESTRITTSMRNGAILGAGRGAYTGFTSGEAVGGTVTFGTSGLAGAAGGAVVGGLAGTIMGFAHGAIAGQVCQSSGWYN